MRTLFAVTITLIKLSFFCVIELAKMLLDYIIKPVKALFGFIVGPWSFLLSPYETGNGSGAFAWLACAIICCTQVVSLLLLIGAGLVVWILF
jgi:hypothetical protein